MTATPIRRGLDRPGPRRACVDRPDTGGRGAATGRPRHAILPNRRTRLRWWWHVRSTSLAWFTPLLLLSGAIQLFNMGGAPQRIDDEGTNVAQAYAAAELGQLTHISHLANWFVHPPLGWLQVAGWAKLTDAFGRYEPAVLAGREFMLVAHLVAVVMLWLLARRLGFARPTAAAAVAVYALSPLAVQFHRTVYLDNVATPWLLAAFVLVLAPKRQPVALIGAAVCFSIAVLSKQSYLFLLPFLVWVTWRGAHRDVRRNVLPLAASVVVLFGLGYALLAIIKREVVAAANRANLIPGDYLQLGNGKPNGSVFDAGSPARIAVGQWLQLDPVLAVVAPLAALVCLLDRRIRPLAAALLFLLVFMLRPGHLSVSYVIAMIPLAALVVPGAVQVLVTRARPGRIPVVGWGALVAAVTTLIAGIVAAPVWGGQLRSLLLADLDQPMRQAESWVAANVDRNGQVVADDALWVDLVRDGFPPGNLTSYNGGRLAAPAVPRLALDGWRGYDYVVATNSLRTFPAASPAVSEALRNSVEVASFGSGTTAVQVWQVHQGGIAAARRQAAADQRASAAAGTELAQNTRLVLGPGVKDLMTGGRVDARVLIVVTQLTNLGRVQVADLPAVAGEEELQRPRRKLLIAGLNGRPLDSVAAGQITRVLTAQPAPYAPRSIERTPEGLLIGYDANAPSGLLTAPEAA